MRHLLVIISLFYALEGIGQDFHYRHYTVDDGLPSSEVYDVHQDQEGFIWVATDRGVCRFDGYAFEKFDTRSGLSDNTVFIIEEDDKGRLWFGSYSGRLTYYEDGAFIQHPANDELTNLVISGGTRSLYCDRGDTVWIGTTILGLMKVHPDGRVERMRSTRDSTNANFLKEIDPGGIVYGYGRAPGNMDEHLIKLAVNSPTNSYTLKIDFHNTRYGGFATMLQSGHYLKAVDNHVFELKDSLIRTTSFSDRIIHLDKDEHGVWIGFYEQGLHYYPNGDFTAKPVTFLQGHSGSSVITDKEGGLWFTTLDDGLWHLPSTAHYSYTVPQLPFRKVYAVEGNKNGAVWAGFDAGRICWLKDDSVAVINTGYEGSVTHLMVDAWQNLWVKCYRKTLLFKADQTISEMKGGNTFCMENDSVIWSATMGQVRQYVNYELVTDIQNFRFSDSIVQSSFSAIAITCTGKDTLLITSINGLWRYTDSTFTKLGAYDTLLSRRIEDIIQFGDQIALATLGQGIVFLENEKVVEQVTTKNGLVSNLCHSIVSDGDRLWVGTNFGLSRMFRTNSGWNIRNFNTSNLLLSNQVNDIAIESGKVFLATNKGLSVIDKGKIYLNTVPPPVYITQVNVNGRDTTLQAAYELRYDQNYLIIDFVALAYKAAPNIRYRFKMSGITDEWQYTTNTRIQYPSLSPGAYTFELEAENEDGLWSESPAIVMFTIQPPFWGTWWFWPLLLTCGAVLLMALIRTRFRTVKKKAKAEAEFKQQLAESELAALRAQMNPHFIFNALQSIQSFVISNKVDEAYDYLEQFASLIRRILDQSKRSTVKLTDEVETLRLYISLESLRFDGALGFEIDVPEPLKKEGIELPPLLIQPMIENAVKHGLTPVEGKGLITVKFRKQQQDLVVTVQDNGIGREAAKLDTKLHVSTGLETTRNRLALINSESHNPLRLQITDLKTATGQACGTKVELYIPIANLDD